MMAKTATIKIRRAYWYGLAVFVAIYLAGRLLAEFIDGKTWVFFAGGVTCIVAASVRSLIDEKYWCNRGDLGLVSGAALAEKAPTKSKDAESRVSGEAGRDDGAIPKDRRIAGFESLHAAPAPLVDDARELLQRVRELPITPRDDHAVWLPLMRDIDTYLATPPTTAVRWWELFVYKRGYIAGWLDMQEAAAKTCESWSELPSQRFPSEAQIAADGCAKRIRALELPDGY